MAIRIECTLTGYEGTWVDFRERPWLFGDRRKMAEFATDVEALTLILNYVENWCLTGEDGVAIPLPKPGAALGNLFDPLDDRVAIWLIRAWWQARGKVLGLPKAGSVT